MDPKEFRRLLRQEATTAEKVLWHYLRDRRFQNLKFRRQHTLGKFTVDFYCEALKLVIEVDGSYHDNLGQVNYDHIRDELLKHMGCRVYRVNNDSVLYYSDVVLEDLKAFIKDLTKTE